MSVTKVLFDDRIKPKNVLALNSKVAAIRQYEHDPCYKRVARIFSCSPDQIKRIIKQKDEILAEWENRTRKRPLPKSDDITNVKTWVLGRAVHEWIRRIMYYTDFNLNDMLIRTMSTEFARALKVPRFNPTDEWIATFRSTFNLPDANTKTMSIGYEESQSVQIRDILRYVKEECSANETAGVDESSSESAQITLDAEGSRGVEYENIEAEGSRDEEVEDIEEIKIENENLMESDIVMESEDQTLIQEESNESTNSAVVAIKVDPETTELQPVQQETTELQSVQEETTCATGFDDNDIHSEVDVKPDLQMESLSEIKTEPAEEAVQETPKTEQVDNEPKEIAIHSHKAAIACVKLLEDFALLKENFRLIGLIERLEEALN